MKIVLATHDAVFGRYVAATLAAAGQVDRVLIESSRATPSFYWRKLRRLGVVNAGFQYWLNRRFTREGASVLPALALPPHERVASLNTLTFASDELVLGFGTSYITARTLSAAPNGILNLHTGVLPQYRGVKSEFWASYNDDPEHVGWTVHYMTPQLDAGDIVLRGTVPWTGESPGQLRALIVRDAVTALIPFLASVRRGDDPIVRTAQNAREGRYYSAPTWREWRAWRAAGGRGAARDRS